MSDSALIEENYASSRELYAGLGIDTEKALEALGRVAISLQCRPEADGTDARRGSIHELREDLHEAFRHIPARRRLGLCAVLAEGAEAPPERNVIEPAHFRGWVEWANQEGLKLDFAAACYGHPLSASGFTLSHPEKDVRRFWIEHVRRSRKIGAFIGRELKAPCIHALFVPDGSAGEAPFDRWGRRERLRESLEEIFETRHSPSQMKDALEFRPAGDDAFQVASLDFCMGYAMSRGTLLSLGLGRGLSAASAADRISALLQFSEEVLIRVSGDVPWEDARAGLPDDGALALAREIIRGGASDRVHIGMEDPGTGPFRAGAWAAGGRAMLKTLLVALLENEAVPHGQEEPGDARRREIAEGLRGLPLAAVWDQHCLRAGVPSSAKWRPEVAGYEKRKRAR